MVPPDDSQELICQSRPVHWVIRSSDLGATLDFLTAVFGMHVLRHEEFDEPCSITCNGNYRTPWSKTMVGYGPEDQGYAVEVTYNYGVSGYATGCGLAHIAVGVDDLEAATAVASGMGYASEGGVIIGPDGYRFRAVAQSPGRAERFRYVALNVADAARAAGFYERALGMRELPADLLPDLPAAAAPGAAAPPRALAHDPAGVPLVLLEIGAAVRLEEWEGRNAIAVPGRAMRAAYLRIREGGHGGAVLHPLREFNELPAVRRTRGLPPMPCKPPPDEVLRTLREDPSARPPMGTLAVAIVTDADGYEICLVSSEAFDENVARAYNPGVQIDWDWRSEAQAGRRGPTPQHVLACV